MLLFWEDQPIAYSSMAHLHLVSFPDTVRVALVFYFWLMARLQYERMRVVVFNCFCDPYIVDVYVVCFLSKFDIWYHQRGDAFSKYVSGTPPASPYRLDHIHVHVYRLHRHKVSWTKILSWEGPRMAHGCRFARLLGMLISTERCSDFTSEAVIKRWHKLKTHVHPASFQFACCFNSRRFCIIMALPTSSHQHPKDAGLYSWNGFLNTSRGGVFSSSCFPGCLDGVRILIYLAPQNRRIQVGYDWMMVPLPCFC